MLCPTVPLLHCPLPSDTVEGTLTPQLPCIHKCFGGQRDVAHILQALARDGSPFALDTLRTLERMSPTSLVLTFELFQRGLTQPSLTHDQCLDLEEHVGVQLLAAGDDFFRGVQSLLVDKGKTQPRWDAASVAAVSKEAIERLLPPSVGGHARL